MRHVPMEDLLRTVFTSQDGRRDKRRLARAHKRASNKRAVDRRLYIDNNGATKWSPIKDRFTALLGNKCWYTEAELVGASLTIDHYRPRCDYWFLAFKADNYRVACPFANSPKHNKEYGCAGGKGDQFPLIDPAKKAKGIRSVKNERPVILDPCSANDCKLVAFQPDGRPVIHPDFAEDPVALDRLERSKILLNLDHPDFNSKREQLCNDIADDVRTVQELADDSATRQIIVDRLKRKLSKTAPFSSAARYYLKLHRTYQWVEELLSGS